MASSLELNPSFDHDVNQHRYRASDFVGGWSVRPIVSTPDGTFDHDDGIEMFQLGREGVLRSKKQCLGGCPANIIIQVCTVLTSSSAILHHHHWSVLVGMSGRMC